MKLKTLVEAKPSIDHVVSSRAIAGEISYELSGVKRRFLEIIADISAFEENTITEIKLVRKNGDILYPGQDPVKFREYMERRDRFLNDTEVEIDIPQYTYEQLKPAGLSSDDIVALQDVGMMSMNGTEKDDEKKD